MDIELRGGNIFMTQGCRPARAFYNVRKHKRCSAGIGLPEILTVIALIGIVLSIGIGDVGTIARQTSVRDESLKIVTQLQRLRSEALRTRREIDITFNSTGFSWTYAGLPVDSSDIYTLHSGISWESNPSAFYFTGLGIARDLSSIEQIIEIKRGDQRARVSVNRNGLIERAQQ